MENDIGFLLGKVQTLSELLLAEKQRSLKYAQQVGKLQVYLMKKRDIILLSVKVEDRLQELEEIFLPHQYRNGNHEHRLKWTLILTCPDPPYSTNVQLTSFRASVAHIDQSIFIETICALYPDSSPSARQQISFPFNYDDSSIYRILSEVGFPRDVRRVQVVHGILAPISLPPPNAPAVP